MTLNTSVCVALCCVVLRCVVRLRTCERASVCECNDECVFLLCSCPHLKTRVILDDVGGTHIRVLGNSSGGSKVPVVVDEAVSAGALAQIVTSAVGGKGGHGGDGGSGGDGARVILFAPCFFWTRYASVLRQCTTARKLGKCTQQRVRVTPVLQPEGSGWTLLVVQLGTVTAGVE